MEVVAIVVLWGGETDRRSVLPGEETRNRGRGCPNERTGPMMHG